MVFKLATKLLAFLVAALQAEARRATDAAVAADQDICQVEAQRTALVLQANLAAERARQELEAVYQERRSQSARASALAANLSLLTAVTDKE